MMKKGLVKRFIVAILIILSGFFFYSCGEKPAKKVAEPIKLGVAGPHSGDLASHGMPTVNAAELVAEHINGMGGVNGRMIELIIGDDACNPQEASNTATRLVEEGVHGVLGHICRGTTKAALNTYNDSNIVVISPSASNPPLTQSGDYPNFFRTIAPDDSQARLQVDFVLNVLRRKKIAVLHDNGDYGKSLAEFVKSFLEKDKRAQVVMYEGITLGASDYSVVVKKIKLSKAEAVIFSGYHPEASRIVTQIRKKKMGTIFIYDDGVKDDNFIKVAGKYAEGVYASGPIGTTNNPMAIEAIEAHKKKYGSNPGVFFLNAYSAALALLNAIEKSRSTVYDDIVKSLRTEFVETPLGKLRFDERGDAIGIPSSMYQVQNGVYVEIKLKNS